MAGLVGAVLIVPGVARPQPGDTADPRSTAEVRDITAEVVDITLTTASLDDSVTDERTGRRVRVTLAADVLFAFNQATLTPQARTRIAEVVAKLREGSRGTVGVEGHTDSKGSGAYNVGLSRRRANAVAVALRRLLSTTSLRFAVTGRGESAPIAPNRNRDGSDNPAGRAKNRRVVVTFTK